MQQRQEQLERAFLLHSRPYGDTSSLVEAFSREHGRVGLVARGARAARSRRRGLLQPFQELLMSWAGRGELASLSQVEQAGRGAPLSGSALISGFYLNEILLRLLRRDDPHPEVYDAYAEALSRLAAGEDQGKVLRIFEKRLLEELGYGLDLEHDLEGARIVPEGYYRLRPEEGLARQPGPAPEATAGAVILALAGESPELERHALEARDFLRRALAPYLGPKPLKSRELFRGRGTGATFAGEQDS